MRRSIAPLAFVATLVALPRAASASPDYPSVLQGALGLRAPPDCTLCHQSETGGYGTVTTPFGRAMQSFGLHAASPASLEQAIETSRSRAQDSDGDGVSDVDELLAGTDPNDGPGSDAAPAGPAHGCKVSGARDSHEPWAFVVLCALIVVRVRYGRPGMNRTRRDADR